MRGSLRQDALAEPGVVGVAHRRFHLDLRMQAEEQHRRREHAAIVDAHGVHPVERERDVGVLAAGLGLLLAAELGAVDAAAGVLVADLRVEQAGAAAGAFLQLGADHRAFDIVEHLGVVLVLVVVRVDVDDQEILIVSRARLLAGVLEVLGRREQFKLDGAYATDRHVHGSLSLKICSGDDVDFFAALDHLVLAELQLAVADALAGLQIVFVAVPRADEVRLVAVGLALVQADPCRSRRPRSGSSCLRRPGRPGAGRCCCRRRSRRPCERCRSRACPR